MGEELMTPQPLSQQDERLWAALAHASILLNLVTGFLGVITPLIIYLVYRDRSKFVANQSMQAFIFQLVWWAGGGVIIGLSWAVTALLTAFLVGLLCIPFAGLVSLIPVIACVYGIIAAVQTYDGKDFRYWLIADWVD